MNTSDESAVCVRECKCATDCPSLQRDLCNDNQAHRKGADHKCVSVGVCFPQPLSHLCLLIRENCIHNLFTHLQLELEIIKVIFPVCVSKFVNQPHVTATIEASNSI